MRVLNDHFGSMRLKDLHHNVLISCFDWSGHGREEFIDFNADSMGMPWFPQMARGMWGFEPSGMGARQGRPRSSFSKGNTWRPRAFTNFLPRASHHKDWDYRVADLAYAACAAPGFRAVRGGLADAASATVNPAVETIASLTYLERVLQTPSKPAKDSSAQRVSVRGPAERFSAPGPKPADERRPAAEPVERKEPHPGALDEDYMQWASKAYTVDPLYAGTHFADEDGEDEPPAASQGQERTDFGILDQIAILSLGDGTVDPSFWLEHFDLSMVQLMMSPSNPFAGNFYTPSTWLSLDAPTQNIDDYTRALIGPHRYMRVDPPLLNIPTLVASGMARFPWYRQWLTEYVIPGATSSSPSNEAVHWAIEFLKQKWWLNEDQARAAM
jgi:hypothetical protein